MLCSSLIYINIIFMISSHYFRFRRTASHNAIIISHISHKIFVSVIITRLSKYGGKCLSKVQTDIKNIKKKSCTTSDNATHIEARCKADVSETI